MYKQESYDRAKEIIDSRRENARREADMRSAEMCRKSEDIANIDNELKATAMLIFKTACSGGDVAPVKERNQALIKERRDIIKSLGYPEDYTDVKYTCKECSDSGYLPNMKMCSCFKQILLTENIKASGIGNLIEHQSFENFSLKRFADEKNIYLRMKGTVDIAREFSDKLGKGNYPIKNLLLVGYTGTGKTHISTAIAKRLIERGFEVIYESIHDIVTEFENDKFRSGYSAEEPKSQKYLGCEVLIIDDLGTEFSTQFATSCIYNILNTRQNRGLSTIVSTNYPVADLNKRYDDRIYSRLMSANFTILQFLGEDYRLSGQ